jgi:hypothetical protein
MWVFFMFKLSLLHCNDIKQWPNCNTLEKQTRPSFLIWGTARTRHLIYTSVSEFTAALQNLILLYCSSLFNVLQPVISPTWRTTQLTWGVNIRSSSTKVCYAVLTPFSQLQPSYTCSDGMCPSQQHLLTLKLCLNSIEKFLFIKFRF